MDFKLSEEQDLLVSSARQFVKKSSPIERFRRLRESAPGFETETWAAMADLGWQALPFAEEDGGLGGDLVDVMLLVRELARGLVPEPYVGSVVLAGLTVAELGTAEQRASLLGPMLEGRTTLALAYAEANARFSVNIVETRARRFDAGYVLDGEKIWIVGGQRADHWIVAARTDGALDDDTGITLFVVPADADGVVGEAIHGHDGGYTGRLRLTNVRVDDGAVLGELGKGFAPLCRAIDRGATVAVAEGVGIMQELVGLTVAHLKTREQFGVPIGSFQALQHRASDMHIETVMAESMAILAAVSDQETDDAKRTRSISAAKVQLADSGWFVAKESVQLHGGIGCTDELDVGLFFKRMRALMTLFGDRAYHLDRVGASVR